MATRVGQTLLLLLLAVALVAALVPGTRAERPVIPRQYAHRAFRTEPGSDDSIPRPLWQVDQAPPRSAHPPVWIEPNAATPLVQSSRAVLTPYPPRIRDGEDLVVHWTGVDAPHANDFLTLTCGPTTCAQDVLRQVNATQTDAQPNAVRFAQLYMLRCNYVVTYYNYQPHVRDYVALASVEVGMTESFNAPKHGHVALTTRVDAMAVMFNSASKRTPMVQFGLEPESLTRAATGTSTTYSASDMCDFPANVTGQAWFRDPGFMHTVILTELALGSRYYYRFGNDVDGWSAVYSFKARPDPRTKRTTHFLAYADMGIDSAPAATSTAVRAFQEVVTGAYDDFLLHFGDVSYARGQAFMWDAFFHLIEPYATRVPYMVSIGNHEYDYMAGGAHDPSGAVDSATGRMAFHPDWANYGGDSSGECSVPMFHRWHAPATGRGIYWYSFDYGGVHVVQLSSEHDWTPGSEQFAWLERDLKSVDRAQSPWIVLTAHRMMYTTQLGEVPDYNVSLHMRDALEDLLWTYKVNVMLVGHQHSYERSCAVRAGKCTSDGVGPVHIVVGSAGAALETEGFSSDLGEWSVSHINDWGYLRVAASPDDMTLQFVLNRNGAVYDEVTLAPWK